MGSKQLQYTYCLISISKTGGNQTMEFAQLAKYNMGNIFLEKPYTKYGGFLFYRMHKLRAIKMY